MKNTSTPSFRLPKRFTPISPLIKLRKESHPTSNPSTEPVLSSIQSTTQNKYSSNNPTLNTSSVKILETALITEIKPWWNKDLRDMYQRLWVPTKNNSRNYHSESDGFLDDSSQKSWFSQSLQVPLEDKWSKIAYPSLPFSTLEHPNSEQIRSKVIRIYPSQEQKFLLRQWIGMGRMIYNHTVAASAKKKLPSLNFMEARDYILKEVEDFSKEKGFFQAFKNMNCEAKRQAVNDALKAIKNAILKHSKGDGVSKLKFRSKKDLSQSLYVRQGCIGENVIFKQDLGPMKTSENFSKPEYDSRLVLKRNGQWNINIPFERVKDITLKGTFSDSIVALDPGSRTFQTFYSPQLAGKIGEGDKDRLFRLCLGCDKLQSKISASTGNKKRNRIRAYRKAYTLIKNLINEIHWKAARFLCTNFNTIIIPIFETQSMVAKNKGASRLNSKTCRQLLTWSHYTFQQRLKTKAAEMGSNVLLSTEEYTSQTCPSCGNLHKFKGMVFKCPSCKTTLDRDINGARNVYTRFLTKLKSNRLSGLLRWEVPPS